MDKKSFNEEDVWALTCARGGGCTSSGKNLGGVYVCVCNHN